jgi:AAA15 family ATPase/GTPase
LIEKLEIKNFKSIRDLSIDCAKVNVFIGEPNSGKSNILEALGLLSWSAYSSCNQSIKDFIRFKYMTNMFYDNLTENKVEIKISENRSEKIASLRSENGNFALTIEGRERGHLLDIHGNDLDPIIDDSFSKIKFYRYKEKNDKITDFVDFLLPSQGDNLYWVAYSHKQFRRNIAQIFETYGLKVVFKPEERIIEYQKEVEDTITIYPMEILSDTLRRIIFYSFAIQSNTNSTLIFEEPESHSFPYYTKYLGEKIAFDDSNQYFIATHNPYLLYSLFDKTKKKDLKIFITYLDDYATKVIPLEEDRIVELMEFDPFLNIGNFIKR